MANQNIIPPNINDLSLIEAARYYREHLGWTVHPLYGPARGDEQERGKRPVLKGWPRLAPAAVTPAFIERHFGNDSQHNLGKVNRLPELTIDLDSKPDQGASVMAWDASCEALRAAPCERTAGGLHYHLVCEDVPAAVIAAAGKERKLKGNLTDKVSFELFLGGNIVLAPSRHKSGHVYAWLRTGPIPTVPWDLIRRLFPVAVEQPAAAPRRQRRNAASWWVNYKGDLASLDIVALARELGIYGQLLAADEVKHSVKCPWQDQHTTGKDAWKPADSDTVIFEARDGRFPGFKCLHASHGEKSQEDFLAWAEGQAPGIVDRHCARQRVWEEGQAAPDGRPRLVLPSMGRPDSEFAADAGDILTGIHRGDGLFLRHGVPVEVSLLHVRDKQAFLGFAPIKPARAITLIEKFADVGKLVDDDAHNKQFVSASMGKNMAEILLAAIQFRQRLPRVDRILDVPVPILQKDGSLLYPQPGYDPVNHTYLNPEAPPIRPMGLPDALDLLYALFSEFCFLDAQSLLHAIAAFITPFCKGLFPRWNARTPVWLYKANRERAGKDYCANLAPVLYEGRTNEDPPLDSDVAETRKKITSALLSGRRRLHFANTRGHISNAAFESLATAEIWNDRILGGNDEVAFPNELEISLSANTGLTYTPDFANRCRPIMLHYEDEDANGRRFRNPDLHGWLIAHRDLLVSALAALVDHWHRAGMPPGPTPFTSFPHWARVVGGIMVAADLGDPCLPVPDDACDIDGDQLTAHMKTLFAMAHEKFGAEWVRKDRILQMIKEEASELFGWMDLDSRSGMTSFAKNITKFSGRILGGIRMQRNATARQSRYHTFQFTQEDGDRSETSRQVILEDVFKAAPGDSDSNNRDISKVLYTPYSDPDIENEKKKKKKEKENIREIYKSIWEVANVADVAVAGHTLITDPAGLAAVAEQIAACGQPVALDVETHGQRGGLNPWDGEIRLLSLAVPGAAPWVFDLRAIGYDLGPLAAILASSRVIGHNIKFDALWLRVKCGLVLADMADTMTASRLLTAGSDLPNGLDAVVQRFCGVELPKELARSDWGAQTLTAEQYSYTANDVRYLHQAHAALLAELRQAGLELVYGLEMDLLPHVLAMEAHGFLVDRPMLEAIQASAAAGVAEARQNIRAAFNKPDLNPASNPQLKAALNAVGLETDSTSEEALLCLEDDRYVPHILGFRSATKMAEQARKLIAMAAQDGRIHARFEPTGTETGRFSCKEPNLQNIGRVSFRTCFIAPPDHCLIVADYSQIELRVAAAIANEPRMIEAYKRGEDLHSQTAALLLKKSLADISKEDRQMAKAVNFGLLYGQSPSGLVKYAYATYEIFLTTARAQSIHSRFFDVYTGLRAWHKANRAAARTATEVRTVSGRRRLLPRGADEDWQRFTGLVNTPIQGGCADGLKAALIVLGRALPPEAHIVSTVHDEIIVETPLDLADQVAAQVETAMRAAMSKLFPNVPIEVEVKQCETWGNK